MFLRTRLPNHSPRRAACLAAALCLAACAPLAVTPPAGPVVSAAVSDFPESYYLDAAKAGDSVLRIAPQASLITIVVYRGGRLARLGHDHVVASRDVQGYAAPGRDRADFRFRLDQMTVDEGALRKEAGFDTQPSKEAIEGTRHNMLAKVLDADNYPWVQVHVTRAGGDSLLHAAITLHGVTREVAIPTRIETDAAGGLTVQGKVSLKQTDFGLVPFAVLGGAIAVQDQMDLQFKLVAVKL
ncbi:YceI family protein [Janthinobacterium agaricidamnosum]|uniref:YceI-like domain protein n=1 Tax=Janthinobacterium agaricidamnosum NBRC 102515 = DSM 9628 TaxID=1349767 RepID=W0V4K6_9BURK|nr:YceI family protein [Janthinobacterium agaricidamnosum]CDG82510.1 yceI-like domain protein [Janthinobacterium agaricidamnosum NBRC 102515 = DSM 9628]